MSEQARGPKSPSPNWDDDDDCVDDRFDPLLRAGASPAGMLAVADLSDGDGADAYLQKFNRFGDTPTLEQLRLAQRLIGMMNAALLNGDARVWDALGRGARAMVLNKKYLAIEVLQLFVKVRERQREASRVPLSTKSMRIEAAAARAIQSLTDIEERFASVTVDDFIAALAPVKTVKAKRGRGQRSVFYALADLMLQTGAFDECVRRGHDDGDRTQAIRRVSNELSKAWNQAPKKKGI